MAQNKRAEVARRGAYLSSSLTMCLGVWCGTAKALRSLARELLSCLAFFRASLQHLTGTTGTFMPAWVCHV